MALANTRAVGRREGFLCALLPVAVGALSSLAVAEMRQPDSLIGPDSYMRLVRLHDTVAAHRPMHVVARDGSGHGTVLHWSHLLDSFLLLLATPLGWFMPEHAALHTAGLLLGALSLAALGYACVWAVAPFVPPAWRWMATVAGILAPAVWSYGLIGIVHHHLPAVVVAVATWGWAARIGAGMPGGIALGIWAAFGIWLTPETLPLTMLGFGAVYVAWVERGGIGLAASIRATGIALFAAVVAAWLVDPPLGGHRAVEFDRISIVFVGIAAVIALLGCAIAAIEGREGRWHRRLLLSATAGAILSGAWLFCVPTVLDGTNAVMSDADRHAFFDNIVEMQPVTTAIGVAQYLFTGLLGAGFALWLFARHRSAIALYIAVCMLALVAAGATHLRFAPYPEIAAALLIPVALSAIPPRRSVGRLGIVLLTLIVPLLGAKIRIAAEAQATAHRPSCQIAGLTDILTRFGDAVVLASVNDTPELLYRTQLRTVGSLYHRHTAAFLRLRAAWRSTPSTAWSAERPPSAVLATEATLLIACPQTKRSPLVQDLPPDTLDDWLNWGQMPRWLHEVARDPTSGTIVYRITR